MNPHPPRWADRLLKLICAPHRLEEVQGDLHEEFAWQVQRIGERRARWRYWCEVLGFIQPLAMKRHSKEYPQPFLLSNGMIYNYFKTAWRNLVKHKVSSLINLFGLTIGITTCLAIYLITSYELSYDQFYPDKERIYRLVGQAHFGSYEEKHPVGFIPNAVPQAMRQEIPGIETIAAFHVIESEVVVPNTTEELKRFERRKPGLENAEIVVVEPQYFALFKYNWLVGTPKTALAEPFKVVLSERKAHHYFGNLPLDKIVGKEFFSVEIHIKFRFIYLVI